MVRLAVTLAFIAIITALGGAILTVEHYQVDGWSDVGKALLTLSVSFFIGGFVATLLKVVDREREQRSAWSQLLRSVVEVDQALAVARQLILAHQSAKTYSEQHAKIVEVRLILRRVWGDPLVANDRESRDLRFRLDQMKEFVDALGAEYEKGYLPIARQQRVDEEYLKIRIGRLAEKYPETAWPEDPAYKPTRTWTLLKTQSEGFGNLRKLIGADYNNTKFVCAFVELKPMLERRAGIKKRSEAFQATNP